MKDFWANAFASSIVIVFFLACWLVFYFVVSHFSGKRRKEQIEEFQKSLQVGMRVLFAGGLYGKITKIEKESITIEVNKGNELLVSIYGIQAIIEDKAK